MYSKKWGKEHLQYVCKDVARYHVYHGNLIWLVDFDPHWSGEFWFYEKSDSKLYPGRSVFLHRWYPHFRNFDSVIPVDVIRVITNKYLFFCSLFRLSSLRLPPLSLSTLVLFKYYTKISFRNNFRGPKKEIILLQAICLFSSLYKEWDDLPERDEQVIKVK